MMTTVDANQLLNQIISLVEQGASTPKKKTEIGQLIKQFRESLAFTPKEFAQQLDVAPQTVHRWERGDPLPRTPQVRKFQQLLETKTGLPVQASSSHQELVEIGGHHVAIRSWRYIMERMRETRRVWVLKCNREFLAGWAGPTRRNIVESLRGNERLHFYYFFSEKMSNGLAVAEGPNDTVDPALESFKRFKKTLNLQHPDISDRVHGYAIKDPQDRVALGLTPTYPTWIVLEYEDEAQIKHGKEFDVLVEVPVAVYEPPEMMLSDDEYVVWLELPQRRADALWQRWQRLYKERTDDSTGGPRWPEFAVNH
jgi:DNA-binding transcriptional regulator YiaG